MRQAPHPQQIRQIRRVALIIFDPPVRECLDPERMRQVHRRAELGQRIDGPVPPVRGLEHHLRRFASSGHHIGQPVTGVDDPHRLQMLASLGHPHQHRTAPMQIHADKLLTLVEFVHRGLLRRGTT